MRKQQCRIACGGGRAAWRTLASGVSETASIGVWVASQYSVAKKAGGNIGESA